MLRRPTRRHPGVVVALAVVALATLSVSAPAFAISPTSSPPRGAGARAAPHPSAYVAVYASPAFLNLGNTTTLTAVVSGAHSWLAYSWAPLPPGCAGGNVSTFSCVPAQVGTFSLGVAVTDSNGRVTHGTGTVVVNATAAPVTTAPPDVRVVAGPTYLLLGNATDLLALTSGGRPWFSYSWSLLPPGCTTGNSSVIVCRPTSTGTFTASVTVTDSMGETATNSTEVVVNQSANAASSGSFLSPSLYLYADLSGVAAAVLTSGIIVWFLRRRRPPSRPPPPPIPSSQRLYIPPTDEPDRLVPP